MTVRFRVLGPVRVRGADGWSPIAAAQQRQVLAILLAEAGRTVSMERLCGEIWGNRLPPHAVATIRVYVMQLRRVLDDTGHQALATGAGGYRLVCGDGDLDADRFERLLAAARRAEPDRAVTVLSEALALWRGPAMADVPETPVVTAEATRLELLRIGAAEQYFGVQLDRGRPADVVDDLAAMVSNYPLRERLREQWMLALQRCGRRAEALAAYRSGRAVLADELGLEPGPALRELHRAILMGQ